jgi:hypothetical protein
LLRKRGYGPAADARRRQLDVSINGVSIKGGTINGRGSGAPTPGLAEGVVTSYAPLFPKT